MNPTNESPLALAAERARPRLNIPPLILLAILFFAVILIVFATANLLAPYHYTTQDLLNRLRPPSFLGGPAKHLLGTDELGRDILSRLIYAIRFSIFVALLATAIGAVLGSLIGFVAAHLRGWIEESIMMLVDVQASLPFMVMALAVLAFFGNSFILFVVVLGINGWENYARLTRGMVLQAMSQGYAVAVRSLGTTPARLYARHILPNIASALIVQVTLNFPQTILLETSLSFLGLGVQPPLTSLGQMLGSGRAHLLFAWWIALCPGFTIFLITLSISLFGDWVRDRLDPTIRSR
jgi:peptide/nickel transport system permease protein